GRVGAVVDGRAAGLQGVRLRRPAVEGQRRQQRVDLQSGGAEEIVAAVGVAGPADVAYQAEGKVEGVDEGVEQIGTLRCRAVVGDDRAAQDGRTATQADQAAPPARPSRARAIEGDGAVLDRKRGRTEIEAAAVARGP